MKIEHSKENNKLKKDPPEPKARGAPTLPAHAGSGTGFGSEAQKVKTLPRESQAGSDAYGVLRKHLRALSQDQQLTTGEESAWEEDKGMWAMVIAAERPRPAG